MRVLDGREHFAAQRAMREVAERYIKMPHADFFTLHAAMKEAADEAVTHVRESRDCVA